MRHQRHRTYRPGNGQFAPDCRQLLGCESEPVHSGVELQIDRQTQRQGGGPDHLQLFDAVNNRNQAVFGTHGYLIGFEQALQQQNGLTKTEIAQGHGIGQIKQREAVRHAVKGLGRAHQAVAIGIGLDDGPRLGRSALEGCMAFRNQIVVTQRRKVDAGFNRTRHEIGFLGSGDDGTRVSTAFCLNTRRTSDPE